MFSYLPDKNFMYFFIDKWAIYTILKNRFNSRSLVIFLTQQKRKNQGQKYVLILLLKDKSKNS